MILLLTGLIQAVASATTPSPSAVPVEALWLAGGGAIGSFARAIWVTHQDWRGKETLFDCFMGFLLGLLWRPVGIEWLGFIPDFLPTWSYLVRAGIVSAAALGCVVILKRVLIKWAPDFLERRLGAVLPKNGDEKDEKSA